MGKKLNLIGQRFGKGVVTNENGFRYKGISTKRRIRLWELKCDCGQTYSTYTEALTSGDCGSCGCQKFLFHSSVRKSCSFNRYWKNIRQDAKRRNHDFQITKDFAQSLLDKQNNLCVLSGLPISFNEGTASLDRIDSLKHYTSDNVQWVHRNVNYMKNTMPQSEFLNFCSLIVSHNAKSNPLYIPQKSP